MKTAKKLLAILTAAVLLFACGATALAADEEAETYRVTYIVNGDAEFGFPEDSGTDAAPVDDNAYASGDTVTVAAALSTACNYVMYNGERADGTWSFSGWDTGDFTITADTVISGSWTFTPDEGASSYSYDFPTEEEEDALPASYDLSGEAEEEPQVVAGNPETPVTGDNSGIVLWSVLMILSVCGIAVTVILNKRETVR